MINVDKNLIFQCKAKVQKCETFQKKGDWWQCPQQDTYVRIPQSLSPTVTTAELARSSSIFFVVVKTESVGETVTTLESATIC